MANPRVDYVYGFEAGFASSGKVVGPNKQRLLLDGAAWYSMPPVGTAEPRHVGLTFSAGDYDDGTSWSMIALDYADADVVMETSALTGDRQVSGAFLGVAAPTDAPAADEEWAAFVARFDKAAEMREETTEGVAHRRAAWVRERTAVSAHNARAVRGEVKYLRELNRFSDLDEAVRRSLSGLRPPTGPRHPTWLDGSAVDDVDWRAKGAVTPVKDQGGCGSCWAFSATGSIEGAVQIATGALRPVSEQQLVDCSTGSPYNNTGCQGGLMDPAFQYTIDNMGLDSESEYSYAEIISPRSRCPSVSARFTYDLGDVYF